jgi:hypothetical protein
LDKIVFFNNGVSLDVNQFSIITELLGTPPPDVIDTIASENVRFDLFMQTGLLTVL